MAEIPTAHLETMAQSFLRDGLDGHHMVIRVTLDGIAALRAALEAATRERGEAREERDFARNERDGYRIERDAALARLEEATAVIRRIVENHFARITEKGILVYGQPVADTGFSEAIEFLAQKGAPRE